MTFKLIGNELVGQPEKQAYDFLKGGSEDVVWFDEGAWKDYLNSLPHYVVLPEDIEVIHPCVVQFIQWYNQQQDKIKEI